MPTLRLALREYLDARRADEIAADRTRRRATTTTAPRAPRRRVPTVAALAKVCHVSRAVMSAFINDTNADLNRDLLAAVVLHLRGMGYPVTFNDLLILDPRPPLLGSNN